MPLDEMYFSVDVEANGPIPGDYSLSSIGCAVVGHPDATFYVEMKPISDREVPEAVAVSGLTTEHLRMNGEEPAAAMHRFDDWVRATAGRKRRPVFVGFNATFDWMFVHWYLIRYVGKSPFSISGLDLKAYYMGMMGESWTNTSKRKITKQFPTTLPHTHNALDDAREQAQLFEKMLEHQRRMRLG